MAYVRTFFAPSYMPFATARQMKRQIIKETKSETYPRIKIVKAAITCSATLNGAKVIGDLLACYMLRRIPHRHQVSERHDGNLYRCEHITLLFRIHPPHDQPKTEVLPNSPAEPITLSLLETPASRSAAPSTPTSKYPSPPQVDGKRSWRQPESICNSKKRKC